MGYINESSEFTYRHFTSNFQIYRQRVFMSVLESFLRNWEMCQKDSLSQISLAGTSFITDEMINIAKKKWPNIEEKEKAKGMLKLLKVRGL